ncbi:sigma-70 family RNA polymerase sigma factor [Cytobacillus firmus]|uniref:RNA polymerase sigma-70 factor, ECF subfamily n=1 Tax=Cytobacillus firmus TaxID=1399 RepID=A0A380XCY4_CYTFI|nr:sigma-70 family RNA polymerase sigma factor [Cytobacillus firmus]KAF0822992.1 RNA polymerase sigma-70 factor, ECF subfamily [Cytobacillus firmus]MBG9544461.1 RNA polymerase sigma factor [Cytobacillus firmus]MBG9550043.1 RNA polymerase sigma factor [Cytobacillus firmus]MBG9551491.1 RNA polymerase sigma factor [Cytobacillus firmus]MBG9555334.1 RNA polymerase sigma factor [Cytobacillus firmus]
MRKIRDDNSIEDRDTWLEMIMDEYGERLTKLAYNYVKDWKLAEDIVQDIFITSYQNFDKIDELTSFKSWIYRLAINRSKDVLKSHGFRKVVLNSSLFSLFSSKELPPEKELLKRSEEEFLAFCVLSLPVKYREVVTLYYYEECSIEEIQGLIRVNQNTIKTRLSRGRMKLKKMMERRGYNGEQA